MFSLLSAKKLKLFVNYPRVAMRLVRRLLLRRRLVFHHDWVIHELSPVWKAIEKTTLGKNPLPSEIGITNTDGKQSRLITSCRSFGRAKAGGGIWVNFFLKMCRWPLRATKVYSVANYRP